MARVAEKESLEMRMHFSESARARVAFTDATVGIRSPSVDGDNRCHALKQRL